MKFSVRCYTASCRRLSRGLQGRYVGKHIALRINLLLIGSCLTICLKAQHPTFEQVKQPAAPDYAAIQNWAALPFHEDVTDITPRGETWVDDSLKKVDVFYIYPTILTSGKSWNADVADKRLNHRIDHYPVKYHASIFNHVGRVYAPRYRQANLKSYSDTTGSGTQAFELAYSDLKRAFEYYLEHYNQGRPIILASHSQGTTHSRRLLKDYFDTPAMKMKLVCAYLVGYALYPKNYAMLTPCMDPTETNCYVTWASFRDGFPYAKTGTYYGEVCVNPITWKRDTVAATSQGGILLGLHRKKRFTSTAHISGNQLMVKTNMALMRKRKVLHVADFSLFYMDVRKNAALRVEEYFRKQ
jgi:hypothetical protein